MAISERGRDGGDPTSRDPTRAANRRCAVAAPLAAAMALTAASAAPTAAKHWIDIPGVGWEGAGASVVATNLDRDPRPDLILMANDAPASGVNRFRYRMGFNLDPSGIAETGSPWEQISGVDVKGLGAGAAVADLNGNGRPELVLMAYGEAGGGHVFRYHVGYDLGEDGLSRSWTPIYYQVPGIGGPAEGADIVVTNLNDDPRPEFLVMAYADGKDKNTFRYRVGFDVDPSGEASRWSEVMEVEGVGGRGDGAGAAIVYRDVDPRPDLVFMAYDDARAENGFRLRLGYNLDENGVATWSPKYLERRGFGWRGQGAGLAVLNPALRERTQIALLAYDDPEGANTFRYNISAFGGVARLHIELDKVLQVDWPVEEVTHDGRTVRLRDVFRAAGIEVQVARDKAFLNDEPYGWTDAELDALLEEEMDTPPADPREWHLYGAVLSNHVDGLGGVMFDAQRRRGFAVFADAPLNNPENDAGARMMRTLIHEVGHALCLKHTHGDASAGTDRDGATIMNQGARLAADWDFGWSAPSLHHFYDRAKTRWRPDGGPGFFQCY